MTTIEQINKTERLLHATKGRLRELKQSNWINENYKKKPVDHEAIKQAEQQINQYRKALSELYKTI